jgi:uncharacterized protein
MKLQQNISKVRGTVGDLRINISNLSYGIHNYKLSTEPKYIGLDERFNKPIDVEVELDKSSSQIYFEATINADGSFECDRCLNEFEMHIGTKFEMVYMYRQTSDLEEISDDVRIIGPDTNLIDLAEDVREFTMLALPIKILCSDDCAGLCPTCGTNLNEKKCSCNIEAPDSCWEPLSKLLKDTK